VDGPDYKQGLLWVLFKDEPSVDFTVYSNERERTVWQAATVGQSMCTGRFGGSAGLLSACGHDVWCAVS
jgi:hypothetical protein